MSNLQKVRDMYAAFGRGDVPAILEHLAEDIEWEYGAAPNPVPWLQPRRGRAQVVEFFKALGDVEFQRFEPTTLLEGERLVVALVSLEATVKSTGRKVVEEDYAHVWRFDDRGRVVRFRHAGDTYQHAQACRP